MEVGQAAKNGEVYYIFFIFPAQNPILFPISGESLLWESF